MKACPPENERNRLQEINISHLGKRKSSSKVPAGRGYVNSQEGRLFPILFGSSTYKFQKKKRYSRVEFVGFQEGFVPSRIHGEWYVCLPTNLPLKNKQMLVNTPFASIRHGIDHLTTS